LRALDTIGKTNFCILRLIFLIEDDTSFPKDKKVPLLNTFHTKLRQPGWKFVGCKGTEHEILLLANFDIVISTFGRLKPE
jgi:farnesyl-diphosphate farnesyltransferase